MAQYFDEAAWDSLIQQPDWYHKVAPEYRRILKLADSSDVATAEAIKHEVRVYAEDRLRRGLIALGNDGPDLDVARAPIDTLVIHHTSSAPGYTLDRMNAVHLLNIYVPYYLNPTVPGEKGLKNKPIWSNHFDQVGRQVFYAYHWFMRMDGTFERLLGDEEIGWQAGNWDINTRSVAICLDNDYELTDPAHEIIERLGAFIHEHYPSVGLEAIVGHREVARSPTVCPGGNWLGESGWRSRLLDALRGAR